MTHRVTLCIILAVAGCAVEQPPDDVLDQELFATVYAELVENERTLSQWTTYNIRKYHPDSTLAKAGVTREQMVATMEYYNQEPERWQEFYLDVVKRLEGLQETQSGP
ncbi:MAG: DUF4296 domain-containing protein [Ignavibacteria bacterium]|nr:DUF4296 domain-containing protein [Ignavibacteria bacterium]